MMAAGSLTIHLMTQHGRVAETRRRWRTPTAGAGPQNFRMKLPAKEGLRRCPVEGCLGHAAARTAMRLHFLHRHVLNTVIIMEEGNPPHHSAPDATCFPPSGPECQAPCHSPVYQGSGAERKRRRLAEAEAREILERAFEAYREPLQNVSTLRYLGRVLTAGDDGEIRSPPPSLMWW